MLTHARRKNMLFPNEKEAIERVLAAGEGYGYGNMIAHLKKAWAEMLIKKYKIPEKSALQAADSDAYPLDPNP